MIKKNRIKIIVIKRNKLFKHVCIFRMQFSQMTLPFHSVLYLVII